MVTRGVIPRKRGRDDGYGGGTARRAGAVLAGRELARHRRRRLAGPRRPGRLGRPDLAGGLVRARPVTRRGGHGRAGVPGAGAPGAAVERQGYQATGGSSLASLGKLANSRILHRGWALRHRLLGPRGMLYDPADAAAYEVDHELMWSFITSVGGGTDQIQRNIIGERILGLPKGHEPASPGKPPRSCTTSGPGRQRSSWATPPPTARPSPSASASSPRRSRLLVLAGPGFAIAGTAAQGFLRPVA